MIRITLQKIHQNPLISLGGVTESISYDRYYRAWSVDLYVCLSDFMHQPLDLDGMRCHLAGTLVLHGHRSPMGRGIWGSKPPVHNDALLSLNLITMFLFE